MEAKSPRTSEHLRHMPILSINNDADVWISKGGFHDEHKPLRTILSVAGTQSDSLIGFDGCVSDSEIGEHSHGSQLLRLLIGKA